MLEGPNDAITLPAGKLGMGHCFGDVERKVKETSNGINPRLKTVKAPTQWEFANGVDGLIGINA